MLLVDITTMSHMPVCNFQAAGSISTDLATPLAFTHHSRPLVSQHCVFCGLPGLWSTAVQDQFHFVKSMALNYSAVGTYVFPASPFCKDTSVLPLKA